MGTKFKSGSAAAGGALSGELAPNPEDEERPGLEDDSAAASVVEAGGGADETRLMADGLICCALRRSGQENCVKMILFEQS